MCYSGQIQADYNKYVRTWGADINIREFVDLYWRRDKGRKIRTPKAMDAAFARSTASEFAEIRALIQKYDATQATSLERELFAQSSRLADAKRTLASNRPTKKSVNDERIAGNKIEAAKRRLANLKRLSITPDDSRIFPGWYAPVLISEGGRLKVVPMRYQCRPAGKPASYDQRFPGTYNARRNNLERFWRQQFGHTHALMVVDRFYENVSGPDGKNRIVQFTPKDGEPMLVACLWSRWVGTGGGDDLLSFAAITDEPEPEVAAAGHDRTIINIKPEYVEAWLNPDPDNLAVLYALFDDRRHPYYEHRLAA